GDPLAAGLDHVLGAVDDRYVTVGRDRGDVAGAEPAVARHARRVGAVVVAGADPRPAHLDLAERDAIPRQLRAAVEIADAQLHAGHRRPLRRADRQQIALVP